MKKIVFILTFVAAALVHSAHAQHFDWVKSYTGTDRPGKLDNWIVGSVTDSDGNLYILGQCASNAQLDGISLVPLGYPNRNCILIAKISPSGNMLWHKTIASPLHNLANQIRLVGDTSIVCLVGITLNGNMYWIDSLYTDIQNAMQLSDSVDWSAASAFLTFSLSGNLIEQRFLQISYIDNEGYPVTYDKLTTIPEDSVCVKTCGIGWAFSVDRQGNVVIARVPSDEMPIYDGQDYRLHSIENGLLSGLQIWVDGHARCQIFPQGNPKGWNPMLMKFSPHFDSLIGFKYIFHDETGTSDLDEVFSITTDNDLNIYFSANVIDAISEVSTARVNNLPEIFQRLNVANGFLVKCDSNLNPVFFKQLQMDTGIWRSGSIEFKSMAIAENTRSVFVSGPTQALEDVNYVTMDGDTLDIVNKVFFLNFDMETGRLKAFGNAKSTGAIDMLKYVSQWTHQMCTYNNRVFVPCHYTGDMFLGKDTVYDNGNRNNAILIWDTLGHEIGFIDMPTNSSNRTQPCYILAPHDSSLYMRLPGT